MQWHGFSSLQTLNAYKELIPLHNDLRELERYLRELEVRVAKITGEGEPIASDPVGNPTGILTRHARTHATVSSENTTAQNGGTDLITPYPFTWFRPHTFAIDEADDVPITIQLHASQSADTLQWTTSTGTVIGGVDETGKRIFFGTTAPAPPDSSTNAQTDFAFTMISPAGSLGAGTGREGLLFISVADRVASPPQDYLALINNIEADEEWIPSFIAQSRSVSGALGFIYDSASSWSASSSKPGMQFQIRNALAAQTSTARNAFEFANFDTPLTQVDVNGMWTWLDRRNTAGGYMRVFDSSAAATTAAFSLQFLSAGLGGVGGSVVGRIPAGQDIDTADLAAIVIQAQTDAGAAVSASKLFAVRNFDQVRLAMNTAGKMILTSAPATLQNAAARLHLFDTTEQLRISYSATQDLRVTVGSTGIATFDSTGTSASAAFSDAWYWTAALAPTILGASANNYQPSGIETTLLLRLSSSLAVDITGLVANAAGNVGGRFLQLVNVGSFNITLKDSSGSSTAANQFALNGDIIIAPDQSVALLYDGTSARWRVAGMNAAGGGVVGGTGTTNRVAKWTSATNIGDSNIIDDGATVTVNLPIDMATNRIMNLANPVDTADAISDAWLTDTTHEFNVEQRFAANPGITVVQGVIRSEVPDLGGNYIYNFTPATTLTSGTDRWYFSLKTSGGTRLFSCRADTCFDFGSSVVSGGFLNIGGTLNISGIYAGFYFNPIIQSTGSGFSGITGNAIVAGNFLGRDNATGTNTSIIGGRFVADSSSVGKAYNDIVGGVFGISIASVVGFSAARAIGALVGPFTSTGMGQVTDMMGILIKDPTIDAADTTNLYGIQVEEQIGGTSNTRASILLHQANAGYKALCFRDTTAYINSDAAGDLDLNAINIDINGNLQRGWVSVNSHSSFY